MALTRLQAPTAAIAEAAALALREHGYESTAAGWFVDSVAGQHLVAFAIFEAGCETRKSPHPDSLPAVSPSPSQSPSHDPKVSNG